MKAFKPRFRFLFLTRGEFDAIPEGRPGSKYIGSLFKQPVLYCPPGKPRVSIWLVRKQVSEYIPGKKVADFSIINFCAIVDGQVALKEVS